MTGHTDHAIVTALQNIVVELGLIRAELTSIKGGHKKRSQSERVKTDNYRARNASAASAPSCAVWGVIQSSPRSMQN
jgi:hypothetical protein